MPTRHDHPEIARRRITGESWQEIASSLGTNPETLRGNHARWKSNWTRAGQEISGQAPSAEPWAEPEEDSRVAILTEDQVSRITSLDDLIQFFSVDTELWEVRDYRINKWEQHSVQKGITPLYQVRANLIPKVDRQLDLLRQVASDLLDDVRAHAPQYGPVERRLSLGDGDPVLFELAVFDPHFGMLAWREEVGADYDSKIAADDYALAIQHLLGFATLYPTERILYIVGNDLLHVDSTVVGGKGNNRGGATTAGTMQDVDSRLSKMFTRARQAVISGIDQARLVAPVDVLVVPGNHDSQQMYRMGEVLSAWYRNDPEVRVIYGPNKRKYYGFGANAFLFTHGEEYRRQRDSLPLIMATECPAELWVGSTHREIHTGHNHIGMGGKYLPTSELNETRSIRTRSLPALTPEDAWHHEEGYAHRRTATGLAFRRSGGLAGLHEFNL
jgi:hypothetical protein